MTSGRRIAATHDSPAFIVAWLAALALLAVASFAAFRCGRIDLCAACAAAAIAIVGTVTWMADVSGRVSGSEFD